MLLCRGWKSLLWCDGSESRLLVGGGDPVSKGTTWER